ncbi:flavohemoglobin expression-modulating QEGLA motif protein [Nitrosophilus kaiyonis]|uniref:flavohemoglobin expression-modulating QEGLA motif protein n=1 Tax=Nitrosophilus kaiyonis TaxID=2930200 RepID=UPI00249013C7|nr:flavohemoglobin expression-modulating QEGLA motif protein [Nitrosophilus kaiyonis]
MKKRKELIITDSMIEEIKKRVIKNEFIRERLPGGGRIHIDRFLPFLCLYRIPLKRDDVGTKRLVFGEAAYIIAKEEVTKNGLNHLIREIAKIAKDDYGAFLLIEIWSKPHQEKEPFLKDKKPEFKIYAPKLGVLTSTIEALKNRLNEIVINRENAQTQIEYTDNIAPYEMEPLYSNRVFNKNNIYMIGVEVKPIYQDYTGKKLYPLELAKLHKGVANACKMAFYTFMKEHTNLEPIDYRSLGRRVVTKVVKTIDTDLANIEDSFDFLLQATPVNLEEAWNEFKNSGFSKKPTFHYRPKPFDPSIIKRDLFSLPIEYIEDPTLTEIFSEKLDELDKKISMLKDRDTKNFFYGSMQVYGEIEKNLLDTALEILNLTKNYNESIDEYVDAYEFSEYAKKEIEDYKKIFPKFNAVVELREDIVSSAMVSNHKFLIYKYAKFPKNRIKALLNHEIGTHILTYFNGLYQPFKQLHTGLKGYDEMQEGLAVLSEYLCGELGIKRIKILAARVLAAQSLIDDYDFVKTFNLLKSYNFADKTAFSITTRVYRGGGLTKDAIYLRGFIDILEYIKDGGEIEPLYIGKIAANHIPMIKELILRKVLKNPPLMPKYLKDENSLKRLEEIKNGLDILNIIKKVMK